MARKVIITKREQTGAAGSFVFNYALWADVPAARQRFYANPNAGSVVIAEASAGDGGITAAELAAIRSGAVRERAGSGTWVNYAAAKPDLQQAQADWQNEVSGNAPFVNEWNRYGSSFDGTSWTDKSNA